MTQIASLARTRDGSVEARRDTRRKGFLFCFVLTLGQISSQTKSDRDKKSKHKKRNGVCQKHNRACSFLICVALVIVVTVLGFKSTQ